MADEDIWKRRFFVFVGARLFGLVTIAAGVAIMFSDILRPGGWPVVGGVIVAMGLIDAVVAPTLLRKHWRQVDRERE